MNFFGRHIQAADDSGVEPRWDRSNSARDEAQTPGTSGGDRVTNGAGRAIYAVIAVAVFAVTLVNAFSAAHDAARRGGVYDLRLPLLWELTSAVAIIALVPLIDVGVRRARRVADWPLRMLWILGTALIFSALHIVGMVALRKLALATVGQTYGFGFSFSELFYEFRKDVVTFFLIAVALWLVDSRRDVGLANAETGALGPNPTDVKLPDVLWLRDGSARIRIEPRDLVEVSSAGNYVEYRLAGGRTHLVRGTLAAEEARLSQFNMVRVHRTRLVNLARVSGLKAGPNGDFELTMDTGQTISGSRRYRGAAASIEELAAHSQPIPPDNAAHS